MTQSLLFWSTTSLYAVSTILYFVWLAMQKEKAGNWGLYLATAALPLHAASLVLRWMEVGHGPYNTQYEVLSSNAFVLVVFCAVASRMIRPMKGLGVFVMPVAFLMMGWAVSTFGVKNEVPIIFKSYWLFLHIVFAKAFGASIILSSCCAIAFLLKSAGRQLAKFPSSERLEVYSHQFLLLSFLFLGIMIIAGSLWAHQSWGRYWGWDPIETSALATWLGFGIILHFRVLHRWSGRRMAYLTLVGLVMAVATLFVVTLVMPSVHNSYMVGK